jgi:hypothetical protein
MASDTHGFSQAEWEAMPTEFKNDYIAIDKAEARERYQANRDKQKRGKRSKKKR